MASLVWRAKRQLERGVTLLAQPGFTVMLARLGVVLGAELLVSPAVWGVSQVASLEVQERLVRSQNELRGRALAWACPEFRD